MFPKSRAAFDETLAGIIVRIQERETWAAVVIGVSMFMDELSEVGVIGGSVVIIAQRLPKLGKAYKA